MRPVVFAVAAAAFATATWVAGWWAVIAVAMVVGYLRRDLPAALIGAAAAVAWLGLILAADRDGSLGRLLGRLGGLLGVPGWIIPVLAAAFASLLAWGAARLVAEFRAGARGRNL